MFTTVKVAAINFEPWKWHKAWNADKLEFLFVEASKCGARLAVAPEGVLEGYVAYEVIHFPHLCEEMVAIAEPLDGPYVNRFRKLAQQLNMALVFGMAERRDARDIYNTALYIDDQGQICGVYNKMQLAEGYDPSWHFNRLGQQIRAFDTPWGRCGLLICHDRWNPTIARTLVLDGARYICIPSYGSKAREQDLAVLGRARENGVPIILANVGRNLLISQGEIVALDPRLDAVTIGNIDIPAPPGPDVACTSEQSFLAVRPEMMRVKLEKTLNDADQYRQTHPHNGRPAKPRKRAIVVRDHSDGKRQEIALSQTANGQSSGVLS
ncbi:MAG: carbon-nitrogen hydrolase family protein [Chloroflexi bacterium]|nr:carbon-nitrogen hydrolase family protein [Chloroflexota bacterium]